MNLVADIGNSYTKLAVFDNDILTEKYSLKNESFEKIKEKITKLKKRFSCLDNFILSSVKHENIELEKLIKEFFQHYIFFNNKTPVPIKNMYKSPKTLGKDRLAGIVAAGNIFPNTNVLVFDAGTALTVDFINDKSEYYGGSISPGLAMRFKALNKFTDKLPQVSVNEKFNNHFGTTTENAILSGVQNGIIYEVNGHIQKYSEKNPNLKVTFTGGDTFFFERRLKKQIFTEPNLILIGLNIILQYNAK